MKNMQKISRQKRVRAKIKGSPKRPRLSIFRSNQHVYAQLIDDENRKTILGASDADVKIDSKNKTEKGKELGKLIAKQAAGKKITEVVFDRGSYKYHGRVKAVAEGAREGGLKF